MFLPPEGREIFPYVGFERKKNTALKPSEMSFSILYELKMPEIIVKFRLSSKIYRCKVFHETLDFTR